MPTNLLNPDAAGIRSGSMPDSVMGDRKDEEERHGGTLDHRGRQDGAHLALGVEARARRHSTSANTPKASAPAPAASAKLSQAN